MTDKLDLLKDTYADEAELDLVLSKVLEHVACATCSTSRWIDT